MIADHDHDRRSRDFQNMIVSDRRSWFGKIFVSDRRSQKKVSCLTLVKCIQTSWLKLFTTHEKMKTYSPHPLVQLSPHSPKRPGTYLP